jgi:hypothetical protein
MFEDGQITWNIWIRRKSDYLSNQIFFTIRHQEFVIFTKAHNSDVGDARETECSRARKINIGRLVRKRFDIENIYDIGFTTHTGTVRTADN